MDAVGSISTWNALRTLDFEPDASVFSDQLPGLSLDFGGWKLYASHTINRHFVPIVLCSGVLKTPRTLANLTFEMPRHVDSIEQGAAWIVWHLERAAGAEAHTWMVKFGWMEEGRKPGLLRALIEQLQQVR